MALASVLVALGIGSFRVLRDAWIADDAFISFRYARNFAEGAGLVWNLGERVEGYTNFLFTFALGVGRALHADIPALALGIDFASYVAIVALAARIVRGSSPEPRATIPFAAIVLALARPLTTFATSGLETLPVTALTLLAMELVRRRAAPHRVGVVLALAAMTRPDHAVFVAGAALAYLPSRPKRLSDLRDAIHVCLGFGLVFGAFWAGRALYYGDLLPNTFRAKSGASAYYQQGYEYLGHFLGTTWTFATWPVLALTSLANARARRSSSPMRRFALVGSAILTTYVVRVGGDFMEHRFLITPFVLTTVLAELELRAWLGDLHPRWELRLALPVQVLGITLALASTIAVRPIPSNQKIAGIAAEETFYPLRRRSADSLVPVLPLRTQSIYEDWAERLSRAFARSRRKPVLAYGSIGILGYRTGFPIVDVMGLTDRRIATRPVTQRGRPGHEREATLEDLHAAGSFVWLDSPSSRDFPFAGVEVAGIPALLLTADPESLEVLQHGGVRLPDLEAGFSSVASAPSRDERLEGRAFARLLDDRPRGEGALTAIFDATLGSIAEFERGTEETLEARGVRWLPSEDAPFAQGTGVVELQSDARLVVALPPGADEIRLRTWSNRSDAYRLRIEDHGATAYDGLIAEGPAIVAIRIARPTSAGAHLSVEGLGLNGARAYVDSVHTPSNDESAPTGLVVDRDTALEHARWLLRMSDEFPRDDPRWRVGPAPSARVISFDEELRADEVVAMGNAFGVTSRLRVLAQRRVHGVLGSGYANGFVAGDEGTGSLRIPLGTRGPALVVVRIAGGASCSQLHAEVRAGETVFDAFCGADDEHLRTVAVPVAGEAEQPLEVRVVDDSSQGWGHLLIDQVLVLPFARPAPPASAH